jgi:hypothetical protein
MQFGLLHLRIARTAKPMSHDRAALPETDGRKANVSVGWTVDIFGITLSHIIALGLLVLATASSVGAVLALILAGCQLCPTSLAIDLFRECTIGGLSSGLISVLLDHRSRR